MEAVRLYEQQSGKKLDDEVLLDVAIHAVQDKGIRDHVIRNANRLTTYEHVRDELLEIARTNRILSQMPTPMDIGALPKGKSKGKGPKGKDEKGSKGKGSGGGKSTKIVPLKVGKVVPPIVIVNAIIAIRKGASKQSVVRGFLMKGTRGKVLANHMQLRLLVNRRRNPFQQLSTCRRMIVLLLRLHCQLIGC